MLALLKRIREIGVVALFPKAEVDILRNLIVQRDKKIADLEILLAAYQLRAEAHIPGPLVKYQATPTNRTGPLTVFRLEKMDSEGKAHLMGSLLCLEGDSKDLVLNANIGALLIQPHKEK
jgi:hypothetical protein